MARRPVNRRPTVADVARAAKVSVGTVSHVLTQSRHVRPETVRRVQRAIQRLRYRPNRVAQSLIRRRTHTVGMLLPNLINPSHVDLLHAVEDTLNDAGYAVLFGNSQNEPQRELRYLEAFRDRGVDGIITAIAIDVDVDELRPAAGEVPLVMVNRQVPGWVGDRVGCDVARGMESVIAHLVALGHRRIGFINGDHRIQTARTRQAGFEAALRTHRLRSAGIRVGAFSVESGREQARAMVERPAPPTAICAANDVIALGVLEALRERKIPVPGACSVVGFNNFLYARLATPSLTTVHVPYREMGQAAARLMLERLRDPDRPVQEFIIAPRLVERDSSGPVRRARERRLGATTLAHR